MGKGTKSAGKTVLPVLDVDFSSGPGDNILPCSLRRQAKFLGWTVAEVRSTNQTLGLYNNLPMICSAGDCYWASMCPTAQYGYPWAGLKCPLEVMDVFRNYVRYIRELSVGPNDHVDLTMIADLVRMDLQIKRIDQHLQLAGLLIDHIAGIAQRDSKAFTEKAANPLLREQSRLRTARNATYKQLLASRDERERLRQSEGRERVTLLELMSKMKMVGEGQVVGSLTNVIDGELPALAESFEDDDEPDPFGGILDDEG